LGWLCQPATARCLAGKSIFDPLTGLRNRHHLEDTLRTQMSQAMRNDEPVSCLMIDIDHFKNINDRFGHEAEIR
jgi:diguanylate cyclase (GGDEF)-like protein